MIKKIFSLLMLTILILTVPLASGTPDNSPPQTEIYLGDIAQTHLTYSYSTLVTAWLKNFDGQSDVSSCEINWGDGTIEKTANGAEGQLHPAHHRYDSIGKKTIRYTCNSGGGGSTGTLSANDKHVFWDDIEILALDSTPPQTQIYLGGIDPNLHQVSRNSKILVAWVTNFDGQSDVDSCSLDWGDGTIDNAPVGTENVKYSLNHKYDDWGNYKVKYSCISQGGTSSGNVKHTNWDDIELVQDSTPPHTNIYLTGKKDPATHMGSTDSFKIYAYFQHEDPQTKVTSCELNWDGTWVSAITGNENELNYAAFDYASSGTKKVKYRCTSQGGTSSGNVKHVHFDEITILDQPDSIPDPTPDPDPKPEPAKDSTPPQLDLFLKKDSSNNLKVRATARVVDFESDVSTCNIDWGDNDVDVDNNPTENSYITKTHVYETDGLKHVTYSCTSQGGKKTITKSVFLDDGKDDDDNGDDDNNGDGDVDTTPPNLSIFLGDDNDFEPDSETNSLRIWANFKNEDPESDVSSCSIDWDDDNGFVSIDLGDEGVLQHESFDYDEEGEKTVRYKCTSEGGTRTVSDTILIKNGVIPPDGDSPPQVEIYLGDRDDFDSDENTHRFTIFAFLKNSDEESNVTSCELDWRDGNVDVEQNPPENEDYARSHTFDDGGDKTVRYRCSSEGGTSNYVSDTITIIEDPFIDTDGLPISIDDVQVNGSEVFTNSINRLRVERGQDIEVRVEFTGLDNLDNVQLEAFISGFEHSDEQEISDITSVFDVEDGVIYVKRLYLQLPDLAEEDDYRLRLMFTDRNGDAIIKNYRLKIDVPRHGIRIVDLITIPQDEVKAGRPILAELRIKNIGDKDQESVKVVISIPDLGITGSEFIDNLEKDDSETSEEVLLKIPECAEPGVYDIIAEVFFNDNFDRVSLTNQIAVVESASCSIRTNDDVVIDFSSGSQAVFAGEEAVFTISIDNNDANTKSFVLVAKNLEDLGKGRVAPSNLVLIESEDTRTVDIVVKTDKKADAGSYVFTVEVENSKGELITEVPLIVVIKEEERSSLEVNNLLLLGLLILLLLVAIIFFILKTPAKNSESAGTFQPIEPYYK